MILIINEHGLKATNPIEAESMEAIEAGFWLTNVYIVRTCDKPFNCLCSICVCVCVCVFVHMFTA
jgi:hypothetical protein